MWRRSSRIACPNWPLLVRSLSTRSSAEEKLRAVPFTRSLEEAHDAYNRYHHSILSFVPSRSPTLYEHFLPFWAVASSVHVQVFSAQLGFWVTRRVYDFSTRRWELRRDMVYRTFTWPYGEGPRWHRTYEPKLDLDMQIYASFDHPRAHVEGMRTRDTFTGAKRLTADMLEDAHHLGRLRGLEEFRMRPGAAMSLAKDAIYSSARQQAKEILLRTNGADSVLSIDLKVDFLALSISPIYVPAFIFTSTYLGETVMTFVHGSTLATGGQKLFNVPVAAVAGGALAAMALALLGNTGLPPANVILISAAVSAFVAFVYPLAALKVRNWFRGREAQRHYWGGPESWDEEYITAFDLWEAGARQEQRRFRKEEWTRSARSRYGSGGQQQQQQRQWEQPQQTSRSRDPKGLYVTLGLPPDASENEIKSTFRSLALKYHPDRYTDPKEKEAAKVKFQKITAAYEVLRNPNKKKLYDTTGQTS